MDRATYTEAPMITREISNSLKEFELPYLARHLFLTSIAPGLISSKVQSVQTTEKILSWLWTKYDNFMVITKIES